MGKNRTDFSSCRDWAYEVANETDSRILSSDINRRKKLTAQRAVKVGQARESLLCKVLKERLW